ncbi:MAG: Hsp20 family protein [Rhizobiales bacterium]|nr:Hsp20 family protein [Hyphomicrobiales bacterium]
MAQEIKKSEPAAPAARATVDPFTAMRAEMDRVFDSFLGRGWGAMPTVFQDFPRANGTMPSVDIRDDEKEIVVEAELPGIAEKDIDVTLRDGVLTIRGEKKGVREEKKDDYHLSERSYGSFQRSFRLPDSIDEEKIAAKLESGVLRIALPKRPEAVKAEKRISIASK